MKNYNLLARTATQKSSTHLLLLRQAAFASILLLAAGFSSCCSNHETLSQAAELETKYDGDWCEIKVINIDSCQYIFAQTGASNGGVSITHKQNCKFCVARNSR